ncbi:hypothetical protein AYI87_07405 [Shewanella sp. KCT]|nr:hypothetical protein AYI87_07405 [Shewanella sp. KCT]
MAIYRITQVIKSSFLVVMIMRKMCMKMIQNQTVTQILVTQEVIFKLYQVEATEVVGRVQLPDLQ